MINERSQPLTQPSKQANGSPIVIGGVGGSGTRLVAQILMAAGLNIGSDLNHAHDNLTFTLLLKRPNWYLRNREKSLALSYEFSALQYAILGNRMLTLNRIRVLLTAVLDMARHGHQRERKVGTGWWAVQRGVRALFPKHPPTAQGTNWGWKEPNSWLYLEPLARYYPSMKYVQVIRHGLNMAFSQNQSQLYNWGEIFGIAVPPAPEMLPQASLDFWIKANQAAVAVGERLLGSRFYLLRYDDLCAQPTHQIEALLRFLELPPDKASNINGLVQMPKSVSRYQAHDLRQFTPESLQAVREFGFTV